MSVQETANKLVEYVRNGKWEEATNELYSDDIVACEPAGGNSPERIEGIEAKRQKDAQFAEMTEEFHGVEVSDPLIGSNYFSVSMSMDATLKGVGRVKMDEICVYRVNEEGLIDYEEFFFTGG